MRSSQIYSSLRWIILLSSFLLSQIVVVESLPDQIKIGGLFDNGDIKQEAAFRYAVETINRRWSPYQRISRSMLEPMIEKIPPSDSFYASKRVCHLLRTGVAALFGPQSSQTSSHVQSICDIMEIPHVETRWDYRLKREDYSINLYPHSSSLSNAYLDIIRLFKWRSFCILYENNDGLVRLQELLKTPSPSEFKKTIRQLPKTNDYRAVLRSIKIEGESNIILDCQDDKIVEILKQAQQIGMMTPHNNYIITSLDIQLLDFDDFKYGGSNITAFRLFNPENANVKKIMREIKEKIINFSGFYRGAELTLGTETALMYDAVHMFVTAFQALDISTDVQITPLKCDGEQSWHYGNSLINYMKLVNMTGLTGLIEFDSLGFRTNFELDIIELSLSGFVKIGTWSKLLGTNTSYSQQSRSLNETLAGLKNRTLIVSCAISHPYIMLKRSQKRLVGNDRYEGFCIDLLMEVADILGFTFILKLVADDNYGSKDPHSEEWNGMIKEIIDKRADMAITDLTINSERESAVDFTMPFMNMGIQIIFIKPRRKPSEIFSFLSPLSGEVWGSMVTAYIGVSVILYILARFTPYEWQNPHPCNPDPDTLENQFTISNCLWFAIGSLMQQGCDFLPQAMSTRMVAGMWWFFTLIMISSYTANLAAFLTVIRMESKIESVEDLAKQVDIKYGTTLSGTTKVFFRDSNHTTYKKMYAFMEATKPSPYVADNNAGYDKVENDEKGLYAFMSESSSIEYVTERRCKLTRVGGLLDSKSYGIALPSGSPYKSAFDQVILLLKEQGRFHTLKEKWWRQKRGGGACKASAEGGSGNELKLSNVAGVFYVLVGGMGLALLVAMFEFFMECKRISAEDETPLMGVLRKEMQFVLKCRGSVKPINKKREENYMETEDEEEQDDTAEEVETYSYGHKDPLT